MGGVLTAPQSDARLRSETSTYSSETFGILWDTPVGELLPCSFLSRSHTNAANIQHEKGPLVYVSGAEAITPKYLIVYSKIDLPSLPLPSLKDTFIHILINLSILVAIGFWVGPPGQR